MSFTHLDKKAISQDSYNAFQELFKAVQGNMAHRTVELPQKGKKGRYVVTVTEFSGSGLSEFLIQIFSWHPFFKHDRQSVLLWQAMLTESTLEELPPKTSSTFKGIDDWTCGSGDAIIKRILDNYGR